MKLREIVARVDKTKTSGCMDFADLAHAFDVYQWVAEGKRDEFDARFKEFYIAPHYCTDTWVGLSVIFLDDEAVAVCHQSGRKSDKNIQWVSKESWTKTRAVIITMIEEDEPEFEIVDMDEEMGDHYSVDFGTQVLHDTVIYNDKPYAVSKTWNRYPNVVGWNDPNWDKMAIVMDDGSEIIVSPSDVKLPYWIV